MTSETRSDDTPNLLPDLECWELLAAQHFGRPAYFLINEVHLVHDDVAFESTTSATTRPGVWLLGVGPSSWTVHRLAKPWPCRSAPGCPTRGLQSSPLRSARSPAAATSCVPAGAEPFLSLTLTPSPSRRDPLTWGR